MKYWYKNFETGVWEFTENDILAKVYQCIQECILWSGENPFDITMGIDYESIFNSNSFLTNQLEAVLDKYRGFFKEIIQKVDKVENNIVITLQFWLTYSPLNPNDLPHSLSATLEFQQGDFNVRIQQ